MRTLTIVTLLVLLFPKINTQSLPPLLSRLNATKDAPLFLTYAAQMERSEFALDEAYQFFFGDSLRGPEFVTDNAGDWGIGFRKGSKFVCALRDLYREPVVTTSYADLVRYHFMPFQDLRVDAAFLVQSSHVAMQDLVLTNEGTEPVTVEVLPFLRNSQRAYSNVRIMNEQGSVAFSHEEFPDGWVLDHAVPYVENVQDLFMLSQTPDRIGSFRSYRWGSVDIPPTIELHRVPAYRVWGRIMHANGDRCPHRSPTTRMMAFLNDDSTHMLTETAPQWGTEGGYTSIYGVELGNFGAVRTEDRVKIYVSCLTQHEDGVFADVVGDTATAHEKRINATLTSATLLTAPEGIQRDIWGSGTELRLYWKRTASDVKYNVYRRDYLRSGVYDLVAANLDQAFFTDKNIPEDKVYGYVVVAVDGRGRISMHSDEVNNIEGSDFLTDVKYPGQVKGDAKDLVRVLSMAKSITLAPGATEQIRMLRAVRRPADDEAALMKHCRLLLQESLEPYQKHDEAQYAHVPRLTFADSDQELMYWNAFTLMRQQMLPPEGKSSFNYYVFSREPQWGWGHGGQVFHESLTMLAYALMDPMGAMNSQRVYRERQHASGYINYRTGAFLDETILTNGQLTSSAPWYAWQNWEVYQITKDPAFLQEMYESSAKFHDYYVKNRDTDCDGLCEWGAHAVLESVRDGYVAIWDQVGDPSNFEGLDVNTMLVMEEKALASMASALGKGREASQWTAMAEARAKKINELMWDEQTGFFYNVDKKTHTFTHEKPNDLKRQEIIGFLPLWAGIVDQARAQRLVATLTDSTKFWRMYGIPSLAADDIYYNPKGYWNGPVWVQWNYLIERGLLKYEFKKEAKELVSRVAQNMTLQLKKDHAFWEFYSPDEQWAGYNKTYIWAGIITRMLLDVKDVR